MNGATTRGEKKTVWQWFVVVEGAGDFPLDMLRYDHAFPAEEQDSNAMGRSDRRRVVLIARSVGASPECAVTPRRWESFGWRVVLFTAVSYDAREAAKSTHTGAVP